MIYCGGDSIGTMSLHSLKNMKLTVAHIHSMRPNRRLIWSQVLHRANIHLMFSHIAGEKSRVRINSPMSNFVIARYRGYINYPDYKNATQNHTHDTNLSDCTQTLFLNGIQSWLFKILCEILDTYLLLHS